MDLSGQLAFLSPPRCRAGGRQALLETLAQFRPVALWSNYFRPATSVGDQGGSVIDFPIKAQFVVSERAFLGTPQPSSQPRPSGENEEGLRQPPRPPGGTRLAAQAGAGVSSALGPLEPLMVPSLSSRSILS